MYPYLTSVAIWMRSNLLPPFHDILSLVFRATCHNIALCYYNETNTVRMNFENEPDIQKLF